jgi:type II secretory pathway component PulK
MNRRGVKTRVERGSVLLMVIFIVALLSAVVMGMLQVNTEESQLMENHLHAAQAMAVAEAGLNDALAQIRTNATWHTGFTNKAFAGGTYTVTVSGGTITSVGTSSQGFTARIAAVVTVASSGPPYLIAINSCKVNQ